MNHQELTIAVLAGAGLLAATPFAISLAFLKPAIVQMTGCKSAWVVEGANEGARYVPYRLMGKVQLDTPRGAELRLVDGDGKLVAVVRRGSTVTLDCFNPYVDPKDTI